MYESSPNVCRLIEEDLLGDIKNVASMLSTEVWKVCCLQNKKIYIWKTQSSRFMHDGSEWL